MGEAQNELEGSFREEAWRPWEPKIENTSGARRGRNYPRSLAVRRAGSAVRLRLILLADQVCGLRGPLRLPVSPLSDL